MLGLTEEIPGDYYTTYQNVRDIAQKYGFQPEDGTNPLKVDNIVNDLIKEYGLEGTGVNQYIWSFDTFKNEIDEGRPVILNIAFGYYENHTVTVVGYSEFTNNNQTQRFLKVYDGWTRTDRYIDYNLFASQTFASVSKINIE